MATRIGFFGDWDESAQFGSGFIGGRELVEASADAAPRPPADYCPARPAPRLPDYVPLARRSTAR